MSSTSDIDMSEPGLPAPASSRELTFKERAMNQAKRIKKTFTTKDGLLGGPEVNYKYLFEPNLPFIGRGAKPPIFFGLNDTMPVMLAMLLGLQHALVMMGDLAGCSLLIASIFNFDIKDSTYLVSAGLIGSGILTFVQIIRLKIPYTNYHIGSGLVSVLGVSFTSVPVYQTAIAVMYRNGYCETDANGVQLPCPDAYGAFIATSCLCALFEVLIAFAPKKVLLKLFPPIVNGPVVLVIGAALVQAGMQDWGGGAGCMGDGQLCPSPDAPHAHPWGSGQFIGLGFSVFVTICLCDKWGSPLMKSCSIVLGLLVGCIIAAACGYFEHETIDAAPNGQFLWTTTFRLRLYGPVVLPLIAVYLVTAMETIGDITATCDVSRVEVVGPMFESRIQGGLLAGGLGSVLSGLMTLGPMASFAENNGVIAMTQCASRYTGYFACFFLILMGVIGKFSAAIVAIPTPVIGGMLTFLFTSVAVSGLRVISSIKFTRRDRIVLTVSLMFGLSSMLVPDWFQGVFTYKGDNSGKQGFIDAIEIVVSSSTAITGFVGLLANLFFPPLDDYEPTGKELADNLLAEYSQSDSDHQRVFTKTAGDEAVQPE